ncbi:MAG TPA: c-type cytochrome [Methylomirabilota bacterium]
MMKSRFRASALGVLALGSAAFVAGQHVVPALAQHGHHHEPQGGSSTPANPSGSTPGVRIGMHELHRAGGVPPGWRFGWPDGDAGKGREAFVKLECYQCHEVQGESFPPVAPDPTRRGPALTGMGGHHPAEYFAESILNPNAVIVDGAGHTGPDGRSIMPDYRDSLTLAEAIDLVAYLRSLGGHAHGHDRTETPAAREQIVGDYRLRLTYAAPGAGHGHGHHQGQAGHHHGAGGGGSAPAGHLMLFVDDTALGEPVPYLPITATIHADKAAPRVLRLVPMLGGKGFHYGADVTLPPTTTKITIALGRPTVRLMPTAAGRFARGAEVSFEWEK